MIFSIFCVIISNNSFKGNFMKNKYVIVLTAISLLLLVSCPGMFGSGDNEINNEIIGHDGSSAQPAKSWTVIYYVDADNDLEEYLLDDIQEIKDGLSSTDINVIALVDRIGGYSSDYSILGANFTDTRIYSITSSSIERIGGGSYLPTITTTSTSELNMGSITVLEDFIDYCKNIYPATNYALIFTNHGGGMRSSGSRNISSDIRKGFCYDETSSNDKLYVAELKEGLDSSHSVDLMVFDACLMAGIELAYEYRPTATAGDFEVDYLVASAPVVWGYGLPYTRVFNRINGTNGNNGFTDVTTGGLEATHDPSGMTAEEFGRIFVEEQYDDTLPYANGTYGTFATDQSLALFDLSQAEATKTAIDNAISSLAAESKSDLETARDAAVEYFTETDTLEWLAYAGFDIYSLFTSFNSNGLGNSTSNNAVRTAVDAMTICSFGHSDYGTYTSGYSGLSIYFTDGDLTYSSYPLWDSNGTNYGTRWYSDETFDLAAAGGPGGLDFCEDDGATGGIDHWRELLDYLYP